MNKMGGSNRFVQLKNPVSEFKHHVYDYENTM